MKVATISQWHRSFYDPKSVDEETKTIGRLRNSTKGMQLRRGDLGPGPDLDGQA